MEIIKIMNMFSAQSEKIDISYYAELAKVKFLEYLNRGIDYAESIESKDFEMINIDLNVSLCSPMIFVRDPRPHIDRWLVLN